MKINHRAKSQSLYDYETLWPENELEEISSCPICGSSKRNVLYDRLRDNVFFTAPGNWSSWRCQECQCSYLDPRPTRASIHRAYSNYYTHEERINNTNYTSLNLFRKLRRVLANGYINWRYSTKNTPASSFGIPLLLCLPHLKNSIDRTYRHLPRRSGK